MAAAGFYNNLAHQRSLSNQKVALVICQHCSENEQRPLPLCCAVLCCTTLTPGPNQGVPELVCQFLLYLSWKDSLIVRQWRPTIGNMPDFQSEQRRRLLTAIPSQIYVRPKKMKNVHCFTKNVHYFTIYKTNPVSVSIKQILSQTFTGLAYMY